MYTACVTVVHGPLHGRDRGVHVHGRVWTVYTAVQGPCTWSVHDPNTALSRPVHGGHVHGHVYCLRPVYTAVARLNGHVWTVYTAVTALVHGCSRRVRTRYTAVHDPNTAMYTAVYRAHGRLYGLCTRPWTYRVHGRARAMYPVHGRVYVYGPWIPQFLRPVYTAVHCRIQTLYTAKIEEPCTRLTAVYTVRTRGTRPWTAVYMFHKHARVHGTRPCRQALNTAVFTVSTRLCTRVVNTAVYRVHGGVPCTRPCFRLVYTAVHGHVQTVYMAVHGPCTWSVHDPNTAVYTAVFQAVFTAVYTAVHGVYGPCKPRHNALQDSQKLTTKTCSTSITQIQ